MDVERVPEEVLEAAFRRLCRRLASAMVQAMADTDTSFEDIDQRLGWSSGRARRAVFGLITAKGNTGLRIISCMALAMKVEIEFRIVDACPVEQVNEGQTDDSKSQAS